MLGAVMGHVCQVGGSSLWLVQEHGNQTHILAVETSRDEDSSIYDSDSMATQSLVQGLDKAVKNRGIRQKYSVWVKQINLASISLGFQSKPDTMGSLKAMNFNICQNNH